MNVNEMIDQAVAQAKEKNPEMFILIATADDGQGMWTNINGGKFVAAGLMNAMIEIILQPTKQEGHVELLNELRAIIDSVEKSISESTTN